MEVIVTKAVEIFLTGITGVFIGMTVLYGAIKLNTWVTGRLPAAKEKK